MKAEDVTPGMLVWFSVDEGERVGLVVDKTTRGMIKADIVWQKSGFNYTMKRFPVDLIKGPVKYETPEATKHAVKRYVAHIFEKNANPTETVKKMVKKFRK